MTKHIVERFCDGGAADVEGGPDITDDACEPVADSTLGGCGADTIDKTTQKLKYPRVAPPEVEDRVGETVREDTPGYIAKPPKIVPSWNG